MACWELDSDAIQLMGFPSSSIVKNLPANAGDTRDADSIPGLGRSPREGNGSPLQRSCLGNPMDEEPGGLLSKGSQRVGHDRVTEHEHRYRIIKVLERTVFIDLLGQQASGGR